jgi:hypothetical protein
MRVSRQAIKAGPKSKIFPFPCGCGSKNSLRLGVTCGRAVAERAQEPYVRVAEIDPAQIELNKTAAGEI